MLNGNQAVCNCYERNDAGTFSGNNKNMDGSYTTMNALWRRGKYQITKKKQKTKTDKSEEL